MVFPVLSRAFLLFAILMPLENVHHCSADEEDSTESGGGHREDKQHYINQLGEKVTLGLGDSCDPKDLAKILATEQGAEKEHIEEIKNFLKTGRSLCNFHNLLDCDNTTKKCTCGPKHDHGKEYSCTQEKGKCHWTVGSPCYNHDAAECFQSKCLIIKKQGKGPECNKDNLEKEANERKVDEHSIDCSCGGMPMGTGAVTAKKGSSSSMNKPLLKLSLFTILFLVFGISLNIF